jgi:hypothetical protein
MQMGVAMTERDLKLLEDYRSKLLEQERDEGPQLLVIVIWAAGMLSLVVSRSSFEWVMWSKWASDIY